MKRIFILSLAATSLCSLGQVSAAPYLGFLAGYANTTINTQKTATTSNDVTGNHAVNGFAGSLYLGYRHTFAAFNLAGELFGTYYGDTSAERISSTSTRNKYGLKVGYGIDLLPGFTIAKNINLFAILGVQSTQFTFKRTSSSASTENFDKNKTLSGIDLGVGTEFTLTDRFSLRMTYKYTAFQSTTLKPSSSYREKFSPRTNLFGVGIVYHYN
jgi:opacity protein-like surface antigen